MARILAVPAQILPFGDQTPRIAPDACIDHVTSGRWPTRSGAEDRACIGMGVTWMDGGVVESGALRVAAYRRST